MLPCPAPQPVPSRPRVRLLNGRVHHGYGCPCRRSTWRGIPGAGIEEGSPASVEALPVGLVLGLVDLPGIGSLDLVSEHLAIRGIAGMLNLVRGIPEPRAEQRPPARQEGSRHAGPQSRERGFPVHGQREEEPRVGHKLRLVLHLYCLMADTEEGRSAARRSSGRMLSPDKERVGLAPARRTPPKKISPLLQFSRRQARPDCVETRDLDADAGGVNVSDTRSINSTGCSVRHD